MIALFLIATCAVPVLSTFVHIHKAQKSLGQIIELDHIVNLAHAQVTEKLYMDGAQGSSLKEQLDMRLPIVGLKTSLDHLYDYYYKLHLDLPSEKKRAKSKAFLLNLDIIAVEKKSKNNEEIQHVYSYKACVEREFKDGAGNEFGDTGNNTLSNDANAENNGNNDNNTLRARRPRKPK
ncbi:MAG: hypothetical protein H0W88_08740 [Parachlamydiaceae bacterium]|nr:hypothetical protein [Parachlamydiaceae bacterium]